MATQPTPAPATASAVTVVEQSPDALVEWNLDNWPTSAFNRLVPTQTLGLMTDLIRPIVQTVQLDIERDTYTSKDIPEGHRAPNAHGLALLAGAAGVDFPDETRTDNGSDPRRAAAKVWATMVDGAGRTRTVVGSRDYVLDSMPMTDAQRKRAQGYVYENALTRARHRALRLLLGLAQSYPIEEIRKPFAVVSYVPNLQNPELRELYKQALLPTVTAMYGPAAAKQIAAGPEVIDLDAAEARNVTPAPATPTVLPGERIAAATQDAGPEPSWFGTAAATATSANNRATRLAAVLREKAASSGMVGPATLPQKERLQLVFRPLGLPATAKGLQVVFGLASLGDITGAQAQAVIEASVDAEFADLWRELVAGGSAA